MVLIHDGVTTSSCVNFYIGFTAWLYGFTAWPFGFTAWLDVNFLFIVSELRKPYVYTAWLCALSLFFFIVSTMKKLTNCQESSKN